MLRKEVVIEIAAGAAVALYTGYGLSNKANRIAQALEKIAVAEQAQASAQTFALYDYEKPQPERRQRRTITKVEDRFIVKTLDCASVAFVGYDGEIHPDYCRSSGRTP